MSARTRLPSPAGGRVEVGEREGEGGDGERDDRDEQGADVELPSGWATGRPASRPRGAGREQVGGGADGGAQDEGEEQRPGARRYRHAPGRA